MSRLSQSKVAPHLWGQLYQRLLLDDVLSRYYAAFTCYQKFDISHFLNRDYELITTFETGGRSCAVFT